MFEGLDSEAGVVGVLLTLCTILMNAIRVMHKNREREQKEWLKSIIEDRAASNSSIHNLTGAVNSMAQELRQVSDGQKQLTAQLNARGQER